MQNRKNLSAEQIQKQNELKRRVDEQIPLARRRFKELFEDQSWHSKDVIKSLKELLKGLRELRQDCELAGLLLAEESNGLSDGSDSEESVGVDSLRDFIAHLEFSLLERRLRFHKKIGAEFLPESTEGRFVTHYRKIRDAESKGQTITLAEILELCQAKFPHSLEASAKVGLAGLVVSHMNSCIDRQHVGLQDLEQVEGILRSRLMAEHHARASVNDIKTKIHNTLIAPRVAAFKKIYEALREGQSGFFKTNFLAEHAGLSDEELYQQIKAHILEKPDSRSAKAWALANIHHGRCSADNPVLFTEVYKYSFQKSGYFFKRSNVLGMTFYSSKNLNQAVTAAGQLTSDQVQAAEQKPGSRSAKIGRALGFRAQ